jgi:2-aminoadipate transaminase
MPNTEIQLLLRAAANTWRVLPLAGGLPAPETFPRAELALAADHAILSMGTGPLQYAWPEGRAPLRSHIAARLRLRGADVEPDDVIVTNGAQDALALALEVLAPTAVQTDALTYPAALDLFRAHACARQVDNQAVRYAMPAVANPTGAQASALERRRILGARWVLEDDAYGELTFDGVTPRPLVAEARDRVFHVGTFSKTLVPGLRVGWLVPPRPWLRRVRETKMRRDLHACGLSQAMVEHLLLTSCFDARLVHLREIYGRRCARAIAALRRLPHVSFTAPAGGFSIWLETDVRADDAIALRHAIDAGVSVDPGQLFCAAPRRDGLLGMRISFSLVAEDSIDEAIARLGRAIDQLAHERHAA